MASPLATVLLAVAVLSTESRFSYAVANYRIESVGVQYENKDYMEARMEVKKIDRSTSVLNAEMNLKKQLDDFQMTLVNYQYRGGQYIPGFINRTDDMCSYYRMPLTQVLTHMVYPMLAESGHLPHGCPVKPDKYYFRNVTVTAKSYAPDGKYRMDVTLKTNQEPILVYRVTFTQEATTRKRKIG